MKKFKRLTALAAAAVMTAAPAASSVSMQVGTAAYGTGRNIVERLDRGISAINTGNGMLVSWRFLANDDDNAVFRLYRNNELIYTSEAGYSTCYLDAGGNASSSYKVETVVNGSVVSTDNCGIISNTNYINIPMNVPTGNGITYSPNDCSVGDVDGDGQYEIFVKWDPSNSKDNSQSEAGGTGNVYIDCYTISGQQLWRIDLGRNIRAGAHYTQFLVADFDCDGLAEMTCKTSDGTKDGTGQVIGDPNANYVNSGGHIITGNEYYTLFEGATGKALDTVNYEYPRGEVSKKTWGDDYGNRSERFLGAVMYCDGVHPSAVSVRGYYTRMTAVAYDVVDKKLVKRWGFDTGFNSSNPGYGDGNHNCMPADVDGDGKQELFLGATCLDDNGTILWCNRKGHGDAMHLGDLLPDRPGQELFVCHEHEPFGVSLIDAATGQDIFHIDGNKDTGRCCADNVLASNPGSEFWGSRPAGVVLNEKGETISTKVPAMNFLIHWDGDLEREIQDNIYISKMVDANTIQTILTADGCASNNDTKANPCLTADIFGDWREETIYRTSDNKSLRIYCTPYTTDYRLTTLMHDVQYRCQVAGEQNCYNQPAHQSFYLGSDKPLPERPAVTICKGSEPLSGELINNLKVKDTARKLSWSIGENAKSGSTIFGDRDFTYTAFPSELDGSEYILTACDSKYCETDLAEFTAGKDITVSIVMDNRVDPLPSWMSEWSKTSMTAASSNDVTFDIYQKEFSAGDVVTLGTNGQSAYCVNYAVLVTEKQAHTQPPTDPPKIKGDVNADGSVNVADLVMMCNWLLGSNELTDWEAGDLYEDGVIDTFDFVLLRQLILRQ